MQVKVGKRPRHPIDWGLVLLHVAGIGIGFIAGVIATNYQTLPASDPLTTVATVAAAIGTWAIGIGANRYAKSTHELQKQQANERLYGHYAALSALTVRVKIAREIFPQTSEQLKEEKRTQAAMHMILDASESLIPQTIGSSTVLALPDSLRTRLYVLDSGIAMYRVAVNDFRIRFERISDTPSVSACTAFDSAMNQLRGIGKVADEVGDALDTFRSEAGMT
ncbi:hypothetical protein [Stenotrophomonas maltophilia]|uniref:Transmembrane protein n=1 Tax=Stenotrophomonas maltophilia TaxID=40324 RepID=A0A246I5G4_STEMA|nr:hypothetical protein [Stenotrophomonas maltophilia]OWQ73805.1 hypothetical protein CEE63_11665 [Stenotrophomonas maltophilia]